MMKSIAKWWKKTQMTPIERYLSQSEDLVDLEQRQKKLSYNNYKVY